MARQRRHGRVTEEKAEGNEIVPRDTAAAWPWRQLYDIYLKLTPIELWLSLWRHCVDSHSSLFISRIDELDYNNSIQGKPKKA